MTRMKSKKRTQRKKRQHSIAAKAPKNTRTAPSTFEEISVELKNAGWGRDELTKEIEETFCNIGVSFLKLKPHFELLKKAHKIYVDAFAQISTNTLEGNIAHLLFGRNFGCFLGAVRLSSSGQMVETWVMLRACVENSLYAFYIFGSPARATIWVNRHKNEVAKKKCRDTFKVANIWAELKTRSTAIAKEAKQLYDKAIDFGAHPNERSVFTNIVPKQNGSGLSLRLVNADPTFIRTAVIYTIKTSLLTFRIFALVLPEVFEQPNLDIKVQNLKKQAMPLMGALLECLKQLAGNKQKKVKWHFESLQGDVQRSKRQEESEVRLWARRRERKSLG